MPGSPLGYIGQLQDPSGPLPGPASRFALAVTQGAGKGISTIRDPTPRLNAKAFVWANLGAGPLDLYLKCMMLRCAASGNGAYIETARSAVGADSAAPLGWSGAPMTGAAFVYDWHDYGRMIFFPDAADTIAAAKLVWHYGTVPATDPAGFTWGNVWQPYADLWASGGTAFLAQFNAGRRPGTTYQYVGHGFGGGVAHLFGRYTAAAYDFAPSLVTRIGSGPMGWQNYRLSGKFPNTLDVRQAGDDLSLWPSVAIARFRGGNLGAYEQWFRPQGRQVTFVAGKYYLSQSTDDGNFTWSPEIALSIGRVVSTVASPAAHRLGAYVALLWAQLTKEQQAYNFVYDLHAIEGGLTAAGF